MLRYVLRLRRSRESSVEASSPIGTWIFWKSVESGIVGKGDHRSAALREKRLQVRDVLRRLRGLPLGQRRLRRVAVDVDALEIDASRGRDRRSRGRRDDHCRSLGKPLDLQGELQDHVLVQRHGRVQGDLQLLARVRPPVCRPGPCTPRGQRDRPCGDGRLVQWHRAASPLRSGRACPTSRRDPPPCPGRRAGSCCPVSFPSTRSTWVLVVSFTTDAERRAPPFVFRASANALSDPALPGQAHLLVPDLECVLTRLHGEIQGK